MDRISPWDLAFIPLIWSKEEEEEVGIVEGDYNTWTLEWLGELPGGLNDEDYIDWIVDDTEDTIKITWLDSTNFKYRLGVFNLADFSTVFLSDSASHYTPYPPDNAGKQGIISGGGVQLSYYGFSRSIQSYLLLCRADDQTIEVWRNEASALWSYDVETIETNFKHGLVGGITLTAKYIILVSKSVEKIACLKGSFV